MTQDLNKVRRTMKTIISNMGYRFIMKMKDYEKNAIVSVEVHRYHDKFRISLGVDYTLPQEERTRIWATEGRKVFDTLKLAGLKPDNTPWGADQYHIMTFEV